MSNENPYMPDDFKNRLKDTLPPNHPANERRLLTSLQQMVFPALMWFFDSERNRAEGRSYLAAIVAIELAMRGYRVNLEDVSTSLTDGPHPRNKKIFVRLVWDIIREKYDSHLFEIHNLDSVLLYKGRRPR